MADRRKGRTVKKTRRIFGQDLTAEEGNDEGSGANQSASAGHQKKSPTTRARRRSSVEKTTMDVLEEKKDDKKDEKKKRDLAPECETAIQNFVESMGALGVEGLRKMFRDQLASMCPPSSRCVAFEANPARNRYADVVCLEESRVILKDEDPNKNDYIHANWVKFPNHDRTFIATQGPLENTCEDFWRMIYQEQCPIIVNLTKTVEEGKMKCFQYWPEGAGAYTTFGKMFINNKKVDDDDKFLVYTLEVLPDGCSNSHIVKMIHMQNWPDRGIPLSGMTVLRLIRLITTADRLASGPVVAHCSAGVGRTGTIILIDVILQRLFRTGDQIDLLELFKCLRNQRASCIQREGQFLFVVSSALDYVRARLPAKFKKECDKFKEDYKNSKMESN